MKSIHSLRILILAVVLSCSLATFTTAATAPEANSDDYFYVSSKDLPPQLLPAPLPVNSIAAQDNIKAVLAAQQHISAKDLKEMKEEQKLRLDIMTKTLGNDFTRDHFPKTYTLLDHVMYDVSAITFTDKAYWHTKRPYLIDPHVKLLIDPLDNNPAYPSGHTCASYVIAEVLGQLYPGRQLDLRSRAAAIAHHRIEAGVHSPDDIEAGRLLAMQILGALMVNDDFQIDFLAAHDEIALTQHPTP